LLLHAIATRVRHARQTTITVASSHAKAIPAAKALRAVVSFLRDLTKNAEHLHRWRLILTEAFKKFLQGPPVALATTPSGRLTHNQK
jgi:hypothetical protein